MSTNNGKQLNLPPPAQSLREAAKDLLATTQNMVTIVNNIADDIEAHLAKVNRFKDVVKETWENEINKPKDEDTTFPSTIVE